MNEPWKPEREWCLEEVRTVIRTQCPELPCQSVAPFGGGWDNAAFLIDNEWVFRFVRRRIAVPLLERETSILPRIAAQLPLSVPHPKWVGRVENWPFAGYRRLMGTPASDQVLDDSARCAAARPLGEFLRSLHDQPYTGLAVIPDPFDRLDIAKWQSRANQLLIECDSDVNASALRRVLNEVDTAPSQVVLSHADLYSRHLLFDTGRLSGIIDWGDICLAEPAVDLAIAFTFLPSAARSDFFAAYGTINEATASRARFRAVGHTLSVLHYAKSINDNSLFAETATAIGYITD